MKLSFSTSRASAVKSDAVVLFVFEDKELLDSQRAQIVEEFPSAAPAFSSGDFKGKKDTGAVVYTEGAKSPRLLLVGLGEQSKLTLERLRRAAASASKRATSMKLGSIAIHLPSLDLASASELAQAITEGAVLSLYKFDKYISEENGKSADRKSVV